MIVEGGAHELQAVHAAGGRDVDAVQGPGREHHHAARRHREAPPVAEPLPLPCVRRRIPLIPDAGDIARVRHPILAQNKMVM